MAKFRSRVNLSGTYEGFHDGRPALLSIQAISAEPRMAFFISLIDLERTVRFSKGFYVQGNVAPGNEHIFPNVKMKEQAARGSKARELTFSQLLLHREDTDYLSGISLWKGKSYGSIFKRVDRAAVHPQVLDTHQVHTWPTSFGRYHYLPSYELTSDASSTTPTQRYGVKLAFNQETVNGAIATLSVRFTGQNRTVSNGNALKTVDISFDNAPDGRPIQANSFLANDELLAQGIRLRGAPEGSYCAEAKAIAVRPAGTYSGVSFPFLTSATPGKINHCNTIPVEISFTHPTDQVRLTFAGADVSYALKAYSRNGRLLGTVEKKGVFNGGPLDIEFVSDEADIRKVTFGNQAAITAIKAIRYTAPNPAVVPEGAVLEPIPHDVSLLLRYTVPGTEGNSIGTVKTLEFDQVKQIRETEVEATLSIHSLPEFDAIFRALSESLYRCELFVQCEADLVTQVGQQGKTIKKGRHEQTIPFHFLSSVHGYIFPNHQPQGQERLLQYEVSSGQFIYQDTTLQNQFFYSPSEFRLTREDQISPTFRPALRVAIYHPAAEAGETRLSGNSSEVDYRTRLTLRAVPYWESNYKQQALAYIQSNELVAEGVMPSLVPLTPEFTQFMLTVPDETGQSTTQVQSSADIIFAERIIDTLDLSQQAFEVIFNSFLNGLEFLQGTVEFKLPGQERALEIPFNGRLDKMVGPVLEAFLKGAVDTEGTAAGTAYRIRLTNAIESPVQLYEAAFYLRVPDAETGAGGERWVAAITDSALFPLTLQPAEQRDVIVRPVTPVPQAWGVRIEPIQAKVDYDLRALWLSIQEQEGWEDSTHTIALSINASYFEGADALDSVRIIFNHEEATVELNRETLTDSVGLVKPWLPYLLRNAVADDYFYKVESRRKDQLIAAAYHRDEGSRALEIVPPLESSST